jgi:CheY-like chemotaxis protein
LSRGALAGIGRTGRPTKVFVTENRVGCERRGHPLIVVARANDGRHILVVNDTQEIIELFRDIIDGMGHRMTAMSFAPDDLSQITDINPDLVILDLVFNTGTEGQGWQLLQKLRMNRSTEELPIIVCTAATDQVREQEGWLIARGVKVVPKPFTVDDLETAIAKALKLPELLH